MAASSPRAVPADPAAPRWPRRFTVVALFFCSTVICYIDRTNISVAIIPMAHDKHYDPAAVGLLLSSFFWGYLLSQLAGGWTADRYGGKGVLGFGVLCWSLATLLTPPATTSFATLVAMRVLLGLGEGVNFPAIHSLAARWVPDSERARALALNYSGIHIGTIVALSVTPLLISAYGWPSAFYVSGALGFVWIIGWWVKAADRPENCATISAAEVRYISAHRAELRKTEAVPWTRIFREPAVWAIVIAHTCNNWGLYILLLWLPTFLSKAFGLPLAAVGRLSLIPWIATFAMGNVGGWISDFLLGRGIARTTVRKLMQSLAFGLGAAPLLLLPAVRTPAAAVALVTISIASSALGLSGFGVNHLDVAPRYAGVLMGISNTAATLPGIVGVFITGYILQATGSFNLVFYATAAVYAVGLVGYALLASGDQKL